MTHTEMTKWMTADERREGREMRRMICASGPAHTVAADWYRRVEKRIKRRMRLRPANTRC